MGARCAALICSLTPGQRCVSVATRGAAAAASSHSSSERISGATKHTQHLVRVGAVDHIGQHRASERQLAEVADARTDGRTDGRARYIKHPITVGTTSRRKVLHIEGMLWWN